MNFLVLDASVATKFYVREDDSEIALRLLDQDVYLFIAPDIFLPEVANALQRQHREGQIGKAELDRALSDLAVTSPELIPSRNLVADAVEIAQHILHPIYDCLYLALAERWDTAFLTADQKFAAKCSRHVDRVPSTRRIRMLQDFAI